MGPLNKKEIIGHQKVLEVFDRMIENGRLSHAFLFVGPENVGKTTVAHLLIRSLFEESRSLEANPDIIQIKLLIDEKTGKRKSAVSVEQIRVLKERLSMSSMSGGYKVAFIENADKLSIGAANALLKTLEEPKGKTLIILRSPSVDSVLETIASRCQTIRFSVVEKSKLIDGLVKKGYQKDDSKEAAAFSMGSPGVALNLLKQSETRAEANTAVSSIVKLLESDLPEQIAILQKVLPKDEVNKKESALKMIGVWQRVLRDVLLYKTDCDHLIVNEAVSDQTKQLSNNFSDESLKNILVSTEDARVAINQNTNPLLTLEHIILSAL
jgi:DNA polymerase III subunit delta'